MSKGTSNDELERKLHSMQLRGLGVGDCYVITKQRLTNFIQSEIDKAVVEALDKVSMPISYPKDFYVIPMFDDTRQHLSDCHNAPTIQKMLYKQSNGKVRELPFEEFAKLRSSETSKGNWFAVPGVMWRFFCSGCDKECRGRFKALTKVKEEE